MQQVVPTASTRFVDSFPSLPLQPHSPVPLSALRLSATKLQRSVVVLLLLKLLPQPLPMATPLPAAAGYPSAASGYPDAAATGYPAAAAAAGYAAANQIGEWLLRPIL
jgi:hypothetical protein